jgi:hypothetical protein
MTSDGFKTDDQTGPTPVRDDDPYVVVAPRVIQPHSMYFYYLIPGANENLSDAEVRSYFYDNGVTAEGMPIPILDVDDEVRTLAINARAERDWPPRINVGIGGVKWRQKSYIVLLIASSIIKFRHNAAIKSSASHGNHAFYDAFDRDIVINFPGTGTETMNMFCCTNHICDENGKNLAVDKTETIEFTLQFEGFQALFLPDSGGTNMGPPVAPPGME